jgi:hypothetical protein
MLQASEQKGLLLFEVAASKMLLLQSYGLKKQHLDPESSVSMFSATIIILSFI